MHTLKQRRALIQQLDVACTAQAKRLDHCATVEDILEYKQLLSKYHHARVAYQQAYKRLLKDLVTVAEVKHFVGRHGGRHPMDAPPRDAVKQRLKILPVGI